MTAVHATRSRFEEFLNDRQVMEEASQLFEKGQKEAAEKMLLDRIEQMAPIKKDIEKQTARLTARVHN